MKEIVIKGFCRPIQEDNGKIKLGNEVALPQISKQILYQGPPFLSFVLVCFAISLLNQIVNYSILWNIFIVPLYMECCYFLLYYTESRVIIAKKFSKYIPIRIQFFFVGLSCQKPLNSHLRHLFS